MQKGEEKKLDSIFKVSTFKGSFQNQVLSFLGMYIGINSTSKIQREPKPFKASLESLFSV